MSIAAGNKPEQATPTPKPAFTKAKSPPVDAANRLGAYTRADSRRRTRSMHKEANSLRLHAQETFNLLQSDCSEDEEEEEHLRPLPHFPNPLQSHLGLSWCQSASIVPDVKKNTPTDTPATNFATSRGSTARDHHAAPPMLPLLKASP